MRAERLTHVSYAGQTYYPKSVNVNAFLGTDRDAAVHISFNVENPRDLPTSGRLTVFTTSDVVFFTGEVEWMSTQNGSAYFAHQRASTPPTEDE